MEDIDGGLHPAVDGQSLDEDEDEDEGMSDNSADDQQADLSAQNWFSLNQLLARNGHSLPMDSYQNYCSGLFRNIYLLVSDKVCQSLPAELCVLQWFSLLLTASLDKWLRRPPRLRRDFSGLSHTTQ